MMIAICCALILALGGCSRSVEKAEAQAQIAQQLLNAGNLPGAQAAIAKALSYRDDQVDILLLDARIKSMAQDVRGAYESYRTVLAFDPNNRDALPPAAQLALSLGNPDQAKTFSDRVLAMDPGQPEALLVKGVLALSANKYDEAIALGDKLIAAHPDDSRGVALKARGLSLKGDKEGALALLRNATEKRGNDEMLAAALLEVARDMGKADVMMDQFAYLGSRFPQSSDLALDEINTRYKTGDIAGARNQGINFVARFGTDGNAMTRLAELWDEYDRTPFTQGQVAELIASDKTEARLTLARFYLTHGDPDTAEQLARDWSDIRASGIIARVQVGRNDPGGLLRANQIVASDKTNCDALAAISEWDLAHGKSEEAIVPAQVVATDCLDRIDGTLLLAAAYGKLNRAPGVERVYREGIDAHPQDAALTNAFAGWLLSQGRTDSAITAARRLTRAAPSLRSSWKIYGAVCAKAGNATCQSDAKDGLAVANTALTLDPLPGIKSGDPLFGRTWR